MKKSFLIIVLSFFLSSIASADYQNAMKSYDSGDYKGAFIEWKSLALNGNSKAQTEIGSMYCNGDYVSQDYSECAYWFKKAVKQSEPRAQFLLGISYLLGLGVEKSSLEAAYLIEAAKASGNRDALKLIEYYRNNMGFDF
jgi:TPR repeat protein